MQIAGQITVLPIANPAGRISDVALLPGGKLIAVNREPTIFGFANSLALLKREGARFVYRSRVRLPVGALDNLEAIAPEPLPNGGTRLWLMSDDNYQRPMRTLLIALDLPPMRPKQQPSSRAPA